MDAAGSPSADQATPLLEDSAGRADGNQHEPLRTSSAYTAAKTAVADVPLLL